MSVDLPLFHCFRCHHTWVPRRERLPKRCPHCSTIMWNKEYKRLEYVTNEVLLRVSNCGFALCKRRYAVLLHRKGLRKKDIRDPNKPVVQVRIKRRPVHEITKDTLPDGFVRVKE